MARESRRLIDNERKVRLAIEAVEKLAAKKQRSAAWGVVLIRLVWEDGYLKMVEISDTTTIRDVPKNCPVSPADEEQSI